MDTPHTLLRAPDDLLRIEGTDTIDLFHRIAAGEVRDLGDDETRTVVFTTDKGRVVDAPALRRVDGAHLLIATPTRGAALTAWIDRWIIAEDVRIVAFDGSVVEILSDDPHAPSRFEIGGTDGTIDLAQWRRHFAAAGVVKGGPALQADVNPLEIGWHDHVAWTKGCYIGQEVVARLDTYEKVKRHLVRIEIDADAAPVAPGTILRHDGRKVGLVLDAIGPVATAVVSTKVEGSSVLDVDDGGTARILPVPGA